MAEVTAFRNNALPYPVYGVSWVVVFPLLDADGDPVTGATCDSEVSLNGNTGADCTNEGVEIAFDTATNKGMYYLILTGTEMTADIVTVTVYSATSKATCITFYPRKLVSLLAGTAAGGAVGYITLPAAGGANDDTWNGCLCVATIDTNVEARIITDYTGSNKQAAVTPNWNVAPDNDDTFIIYLPEGMQRPVVNAIEISGDATAADNLEAACDGTTYNIGGGAAVAASVTGAVGSVTGNVGGNVVGSTASVAGAVGSVTGAVGSVTGNVGGTVASVVGNVGGNVVGSVASVTGAVGSVTGAVGSVTGNVGGNVVGSVASVTGAVGSVTGAVGSVTGNVGGSVASVTGAVGSVTGNVGGSVASVTGAVGSVTGNVGGTVAVVTTLTNLPAITADWLTGTGVKNDAVQKIQAGLARAGSTWYVRTAAEGGATANDGRSEATAKLKLSEVATAITALETGGHVIDVGAGTFDEDDVDFLVYPVCIKGKGKGVTILTSDKPSTGGATWGNFAAAVTVPLGSMLEDLSITNSATVAGANGGVALYVRVGGSAEGFCARSCQFKGTRLGAVTACVDETATKTFVDCDFEGAERAFWDDSGSVGSPVYRRAIFARHCNFLSRGWTNSACYGIALGQAALFDDCHLDVEAGYAGGAAVNYGIYFANANASAQYPILVKFANTTIHLHGITGSTGDLHGVAVISTYCQLLLANTHVFVTNSGTGTAYDLSNAGTLAVSGTHYDITKTSGTITVVPPGAAILADTNELQTLWTTGGALDLLLKDAPSTAEFNARTLAAADYFVVSDYTVLGDTAGVTEILTRLPNATAGEAGGVFIAGTNAATTITTGLTTHFIGTVDTVTTYTGNTPQTGDSYAIVNGVAGLVAVKADAVEILTRLPDATAGAAGGVFIAGSNAATSITTGLTSNLIGNITGNMTGNVTGNLSGSVGSVTGAVGSVAGAVGSVTGAVGSVTGNVGGSVGSVTGAVGSVTGSIGSLATQAKADVNAEVDTALSDINLDHLSKTAVANNADLSAEVPDGTILSNLLSKTSDTSTYSRTTDSQEALADAVAAITVIGAGSKSCTITVNNNATPAAPVDGAAVWVSTDEAGLNVTNGTSHTNSSGQVTFLLNDGTYWCWKTKAGLTFTNPETFTVS